MKAIIYVLTIFEIINDTCTKELKIDTITAEFKTTFAGQDATTTGGIDAFRFGGTPDYSEKAKKLVVGNSGA